MSPPVVNASLLDGYAPPPGAFDEMLAATGMPRRHWQTLVGAFDRLEPEDFAARRESALRILNDHGVTYNVYGDAQGLERPWALDLVPLVLPADEWQRIERGLAQRTRLLNAILGDLYGPQRLLRGNLLPSDLVQANPSFLRPCHGVRPPGGVHLYLHAVDLARSPDGQWWVLADRTQAPSGVGYTLENRQVLSRVFPDEFRDQQVQRLSTFVDAARDALRSLAPQNQDHPNVVILTPGPYNETYFEQAYLSRSLGFPLVEGGDLLVRNQRVYTKTLEGLQPVDVILRRVDDSFCDPLELRADSHLGVPGLVEAARAGRVALANALGSGAVEMPALMAFLPPLCQEILGEELLLPSVATWWCGQASERDHVLQHLEELVLKRAFTPAPADPVFGPRLDAPARAQTQQAIRQSPHDFVGQEQIALSTVPAWEQQRFAPRPLVLRTFVVATPDGYHVMPGGLTRFATSTHELVVSMQSGGGSKDTWVLADGPVTSPAAARPATAIVRLERAAAEVPSRVADNLFWLGRYAERLEDTVRTLRCILSRLADETGAEGGPELDALIRLMAHLDLFPSHFRERRSLAAAEREIYRLIYQVHRLGTVREVLGRLRQIAFVLRDRFSADTWRILTQLQVDARPRPGRLPATEALGLLNTLVVDLAAFSGLEMENMTRGHGWRFLDIGRRLERAANINTLIQSALALEPASTPVLEPVLEIADSVMTYRRRYFTQPQWPPVLDLLLADESNPRSLAFQINALATHAAHLPADPDAAGDLAAPNPMRALTEMLAAQALEPEHLAQSEGVPPDINPLLERVSAGLRDLSDSLTHRFFSHTVTRTS